MEPADDGTPQGPGPRQVHIEEIATSDEEDDSDEDDDDMPPPLEDMASTINLRSRLNKKPAVTATKGARRETKKAKEPPKPEKKPEEGAWVGKTVELFGLSAAHYNGQQGVALSFLDEAVRYAVKLESGKSIKVRPTNLKVIETVGGFSKGFFKAPAQDEDEDEDEVELITPKNPGELPGKFQEVEDQMKQAGSFLQENQSEWVTPDLLNKIGKNKGMMEMMQKPQFMAAIGEFQKDPAAAKKKYEGSPQVMKFFTDFCGIMGEHLTGIADKKDAPGDGSAKSGGSKGAPTNNAPMIQPAQKSAEDLQMETILKKPDVQEALRDPRVMNIMKELRENPMKGQALLQQAMREPELMRRIQVLVQNKLLGLA